MRFDAYVVMDMFPPGICLGSQELKCYNISRQEPTGEARIDERASLVVSFKIPEAAPIPLRGLVDPNVFGLQPNCSTDRSCTSPLSN